MTAANRAGLILTASMLVGLLWVGNANAATFNRSRIIDDGVFDNTSTMTASDIDTFLNKFPSSCISTTNGFSAPDPTGYNPTKGYIYGGDVSAGKVIYDAAQAYEINPQVLLATLQKESSLITGDGGCGTWRYASALGYGCPDSGGTYNYSNVDLYSINGKKVTSISGTCVQSASMVGFSQQIIYAVGLFKFGEQRSEGNINYAIMKTNWDNSDDPQRCYWGPMTQGTWQRCPSGATTYYDGYTTIDGTSIHIDNGATAALYWYTPHFSGNQSFFNTFTGWFGSTYAGPMLEIGDDGSTQQYIVLNGYKYWITSMTSKVAWGFDKLPLTTVYAGYLDSIPSGNDISGQYARDQGSGYVYLIDNGNRYHFTDATQYANWGSPAYSNLPSSIVALPHNAWDLPNAIVPKGSSTVYMMDGDKVRIFANSNLQLAWEGNNKVITMSTTLFGTYTQGTDITSAKFTLNSKHYLADGGTKHNLGTLNDLYTMPEMTVASTSFVSTWPEDTLQPFVRAVGAPAIYLVDNGQVRHIATPAIWAAWAPAGNQGITSLSAAALATITAGGDINSLVATASTTTFVVDKELYAVTNTSQQLGTTNTQSAVSISSALSGHYSQGTLEDNIEPAGLDPVYQIVEGQKLHYESMPDYRLWEGSQRGKTVLDNSVISALFPDAPAPMSALFTSGGTDYVMAASGKYYAINSTQETQYGIAGLAKPTLPSWLLAEFTNGGSFSQDATSGSGSYYFVAKGVPYQTSDSKLAALWGINTSTVTLSPDFLQKLSATQNLTPFIFVPSDKRILMQNHDTLLHVTNMANLYNLRYTASTTLVRVDASNLSAAAATVVEYELPLVKDASAKYYVIDSGAVRPFADTTTQGNWVGDGSGVDTASAQLLAYLPTGSTVTNSVKSSDANPIYAGKARQLRWILSMATYNSGYAPYTTVSPLFIQAFPHGANLP